MSNHGDPRIVKLCAATNNSSSEDMASTTTTTSDDDDDLPTFEHWYRTAASSPRDDTDHTSLVVQASSSSRSVGDVPYRSAMMNIPNILTPLSPPSGSTVPLLGVMEYSTAELNPMHGQVDQGDSIVQCEGGIADKKGEGSSGMELSISSSNQLEILNNLQTELEETRAALEMTEKQLTDKMDKNDDAAKEITKAWKMVRQLQTERSKPTQQGQKVKTLKNSELLLHILHQVEQEGGPEGAWLSQVGLEEALIHLYMAREDAIMVKKHAQEQIKEISEQYQSLQGRLQCLTAGLQGLLGKPQEDGMLEDIGQEGYTGRATEREEISFTLLEQLKNKLHSQDLQATRWQMMTSQLRRELEQSRQRCESKMETLCQVEEECRRRTEEVESEKLKGRKQDQLIQAFTAKMAECDRENVRSQQIHSDLKGRIGRLSEQLHKTLKEHEENLKCQQKVVSLEEQLKIAKITCNELWEQKDGIASQLAVKTTELEKLQNSSSNGLDATGSMCVGCSHDVNSSTHCDPLISANAMEEIREQFVRQMALAEELEAERQKSYQLRNARLAGEESAYLNQKTELSKEREALQEVQKKQEMFKQKMEEERRLQEERVQKMTQSLLEVSQVRGHLTSDLSQTQHEAEKFRRQLVAASTALEYEKQARETVQVKFDQSEGQVAQMQHQLTMLQQNYQLTNQKCAEAQRQMTIIQSERDKYTEEYARVSAELKKTTEAMQALERHTSVTMATRELEANAKLTEKAILNSDLARRLEIVTGERNEMNKKIKSLEEKLRDYNQTVANLQTAKTCCEELQSQVAQLTSDLATSQISLQELTALKQQQDADLDNSQEELNSALTGQTAVRKKFKKQKAESESALRSLEEEKDVLTNKLTEASKNLVNIQQQLTAAMDSKMFLIQDKQKLRTTCNALEEQRKLDQDELQKTLCKTDNLTQQLEEERNIKNECADRLSEAKASLASTKIELNEQRLKVTTLSTEMFALRDTTRCQKKQIVELTGQVQDLQLELQSANHKHDLQYNKVMSSTEKTISELDKICETQDGQLKDVCKENSKIKAELNLLNNAFSKKRCDYNRALLTLHKTEMKEKEMMSIIHQLEGQLDVEKNVQDQLNKSCENQEAELQRIRQTAKDKEQNIETLKNTMECNTKIELQHIKAELTREIISKIETSPLKENPSNIDRSKEHIQKLEAQVSKLEGLRSVDKLTIASLTEDLKKLRTLLTKQKGALLKRKSHAKPSKEDIQAALAKAHVRALSMNMADNYSTVQSPLFNSTEWFDASKASPTKKPSYGCWDTKSSDSIATSSDEYSS